MTLNNTGTNSGREDEDLLDSSLSFSADASSPTDHYEEYLAEDNESKQRDSDTRNFFDDSNREDRNCLKIAKDFLRRSVKS